jgi:N-acetylglutamate synthase-like GNAT family acetyltransferase
VISIRAYEDGDLDHCRRLWAQLTEHHREIYGDPSIGGDDPGLFFDDHLARVGPAHIWVAVDDGVVRGMVGLIVDGEEAEIEPVVVARDCRGDGVGRQLLTRAVAEARQLGVRFLSIAPVARNHRAIELFVREGFATVGRIELFTELRPSDRQWKDGITLHGLPLRS